MKLRQILEAGNNPNEPKNSEGDSGESDATKKAHDLHLQSKGWGKWADSSGDTVAKTVQGQLVKIDKSKEGGEKEGGEKLNPLHPFSDERRADTEAEMQAQRDYAANRLPPDYKGNKDWDQVMKEPPTGVPKLGDLKPKVTPANPSMEWMTQDQIDGNVEFAFADLETDPDAITPEDRALMQKLVVQSAAENDGQFNPKWAATKFYLAKQDAEKAQFIQRDQERKNSGMTLRQRAQAEYPDEFTATDAEKNAEMRAKLKGTGKTVDDKGIVQWEEPHEPENPTEDDYKHYGPDESVNLRPMMVRLRIR